MDEYYDADCNTSLHTSLFAPPLAAGVTRTPASKGANDTYDSTHANKYTNRHYQLTIPQPNTLSLEGNDQETHHSIAH